MELEDQSCCMSIEVKLNELNELLDQFDYPVGRMTVAEKTQGVTLELADGTENLGELVQVSSGETFDSVDDLSSEVMNLLPRHAVGEPYQSEGEG